MQVCRQDDGVPGNWRVVTNDEIVLSSLSKIKDEREYSMKLFRAFLVIVLLFNSIGFAQVKDTPAVIQVTDKHFRIFKPDGKEASLEDIFAAMKETDVVFIGENHDDPAAHYLEAVLFKGAGEHYKAQRPVVLSLEMFESDVQIVVDEYLAGLITETQFISNSRAWGNYKTDYRPMVEYARENKLAVVAANAPRRYVNRVSRLGRASLNELSPQAKSWLPPLPYGEPSKQYADKFINLMTQSGASNPNHQITKDSSILASQSLWDASMAHSIAETLKQKKNALVVHVNGSFHSEERMGIPEHLLRYRKETKFIVVTIKSGEGFPNFDARKMGRLGDFVILTDPGLPRSR